jgi:hypothetical protein
MAGWSGCFAITSTGGADAVLQGAVAGLPGGHDRVQPCAVHPADWRLSQDWAGWRPSLRGGLAFHAATARRTSNCWPPSTRRTSGSAARPPATFSSAEFEVYGKVEFERLAKLSNGHLLQSAPQPALRPALAQLRRDPAYRGPDRRTQKAPAQRPARLSAHRYRARGLIRLRMRAA